ncbi:MAG: universal stress protein [Dehalococcoidia bacterium]|nr:universal stress protein [Dehalococcoidia bacterium]MDD5647479.1 universal stress protein [Dehalococcoidia bacterium]
MLPIKNILCPTDFSDPSYEALKVADELAVHFGATLHVVNVVPLVPIVEAPIGVESASFNVASYQQELEGQAQKSLKSLTEQKISRGITAVTEVLIGNAAGEVMRYAGENAVDMIVIATHGLSGWRRFISGSTTEQIVRQASCPVLTIRKPGAK